MPGVGRQRGLQVPCAAEANACQVLEQAIADGLAKCPSHSYPRPCALCALFLVREEPVQHQRAELWRGRGDPPGKGVCAPRKTPQDRGVEQGLDGDNVRVFLTAMGLGVVQEILGSVKAMRITRCGSMILMADAQAYEACLRSFMSPEVTKRAALLVDLTNMYAFD